VCFSEASASTENPVVVRGLNTFNNFQRLVRVAKNISAAMGPNFSRETGPGETTSFNHFVGFQQYLWRNRHADFLGGLEIDDELQLRRFHTGPPFSFQVIRRVELD